MTYDKLISKEDGILSVSWYAGTNKNALTKLFKRNEIESVNIPEACAQICTVITEQLQNLLLPSNGLEYRESVGFPFRVATNLCFGTLRIYQQQVQNLLEQTRNLTAYTSFEVKKIIATKRRSNNERQNVTKKRRLDNKGYITNFTELLHESEETNWTQSQYAQQESIEVENSFPAYSKFTNCFQSTRLQIREVSIREFNIDYNVPEIDDCGFGNATTEELCEFFDITDDKEGNFILSKNFLKKSNKRKSPLKNNLDVTPKKQKDSNDKTLSECHQYSNSSCDSARRLEFVLEPSNQPKGIDEIDGNFSMGHLHTSKEFCLNQKNCNHADRNPSNDSSKISPKPKYQSRNSFIDKVTKLPKEEYYFQFKRYKENQCVALNRAKEKINLTANQCKLLPTTLRKSAIQRSFNQSTKLAKNNNYTEYIDILKNIFDHSVDKTLAAEICTFSSFRKRRKCLSADDFVNNNVNVNAEILELMQMEGNNSGGGYVNNGNAELITNKTNFNGCSENFLNGNENKTINDPYSIMIKILEIIRNTPDEIIRAENFIHKVSTNRKEAAVTFSSLLGK